MRVFMNTDMRFLCWPVLCTLSVLCIVHYSLHEPHNVSKSPHFELSIGDTRTQAQKAHKIRASAEQKSCIVLCCLSEPPKDKHAFEIGGCRRLPPRRPSSMHSRVVKFPFRQNTASCDRGGRIEMPRLNSLINDDDNLYSKFVQLIGWFRRL